MSFQSWKVIRIHKINFAWLRIKASKKVTSPDFSLDEIKHGVSELKTDRCVDPSGLDREVFKTSGDGFFLSVPEMVNFIKRSKVIALEWDDICIKI